MMVDLSAVGWSKVRKQGTLKEINVNRLNNISLQLTGFAQDDNRILEPLVQ
jgi:hypothetical protein